MSSSDGLDPCIFCRTMDKTRYTKEKLDGEVFRSPPESAFFSNITIKKRISIFTPNWRVSIYVSRQGKGLNRKDESGKFRKSKLQLLVLLKEFFYILNCLYWLKLFLSEKSDCLPLNHHLLLKYKKNLN